MNYLISAIGGLVPCGGAGQGPCDFCQFATLADNVISYILVYLALPIAIIALLWAGILFLTAAGNPSQLTKGRAIFTQVLIGLALAFGAWLIVDTVLGNLLDPGYIPLRGWNRFPQCTLTFPESSGAPALPAGQPGAPPAAGPAQPGAPAAPAVPPAGEALGQAEARAILLEAGINPGNIRLEGVQDTTVEALVDMAGQIPGSSIVITPHGATGGSHAVSAYSHSTGYKVDLAPNSTVTNYFRTFPATKSFGGYEAHLIQTVDYTITATNELSHWDLKILPI